jgi:hypothetical protein
MSFFRDPNEPSSSEESSEEEDEGLEASLNDVSQISAEELAGVVELIEPDTTTESLSLTNTISEAGAGAGAVPNMDEARNVMMASMLEELSKYKAAEMMNSATAGSGRAYDKTRGGVWEKYGIGASDKSTASAISRDFWGPTSAAYLGDGQHEHCSTSEQRAAIGTTCSPASSTQPLPFDFRRARCIGTRRIRQSLPYLQCP